MDHMRKHISNFFDSAYTLLAELLSQTKCIKLNKELETPRKLVHTTVVVITNKPRSNFDLKELWPYMGIGVKEANGQLRTRPSPAATD